MEQEILVVKERRLLETKQIVVNKDKISDSGLSLNPKNSVEPLEKIILELKAGFDVLFDLMLRISKQLISMDVITQKQLENID